MKGLRVVRAVSRYWWAVRNWLHWDPLWGFSPRGRWAVMMPLVKDRARIQGVALGFWTEWRWWVPGERAQYIDPFMVETFRDAGPRPNTLPPRYLP